MVCQFWSILAFCLSIRISRCFLYSKYEWILHRRRLRDDVHPFDYHSKTSHLDIRNYNLRHCFDNYRSKIFDSTVESHCPYCLYHEWLFEIARLAQGWGHANLDLRFWEPHNYLKQFWQTGYLSDFQDRWPVFSCLSDSWKMPCGFWLEVCFR